MLLSTRRGLVYLVHLSLKDINDTVEATQSAKVVSECAP